jgi:hypothetical protein
LDPADKRDLRTTGKVVFGRMTNALEAILTTHKKFGLLHWLLIHALAHAHSLASERHKKYEHENS